MEARHARAMLALVGVAALIWLERARPLRICRAGAAPRRGEMWQLRGLVARAPAPRSRALALARAASHRPRSRREHRWRCAQILAIGVGPSTLALWQRLTLGEVLFHHANLRLLRALERIVSALLATPRLHGLHDSIFRNERDSNYSSGLSLWDRLHGTARARLPRDNVILGLPDRTPADDVRFSEMLAMPFRKSKSNATMHATEQANSRCGKAHQEPAN